MVFQSKRPSEDNQVLPGGGLEVDLDRRMCPGCHRETPPWEAECRECGAATVPPEQAPAPTFRLPHLEDDLDEAPPPAAASDDTDGEPDDAGPGRDADAGNDA